MALIGGPAAADNCNPYPVMLTNGTTADASQVMANFAAIQACANALAPVASPVFTGTVNFGTPTSITKVVIDNPAPVRNNLTVGGGELSVVSYASGAAVNNAYINVSDQTGSNGANQSLWIRGLVNGGTGDTSLANLYLLTATAYVAGKLGIGTTTPAYTLYVNGTAYAINGVGGLSDARHKDRVAPLADGALAVIGKLRPVSFEWKEPKDDGMKGQQIGFLAQEVQDVLPATVLVQSDSERTLGLKYFEFIPVLVKALQEQQAQIEQLRAEIAAVKPGK
jgi:hypothetical protein